MSDLSGSPDPGKVKNGWMRLLLLLGIVLGFPAFLDQGKPPRIPFGWQLLSDLEKAHPRGILIGDSMLGTRIDSKTLNSLAKEPWFVMAQPGGSSVVWYLMMKNFVSELNPPPKTVVILFRDRQLTLPAHHTGTGYHKTIQRYMKGKEPRVEALLRSGDQKEKWWLERLAENLYPVQLRRDHAHDTIQFKALDFVASSKEYGQIRHDAFELFDLRNLRDDRRLNAASEEEASHSLNSAEDVFEEMVEESFLPEIIRLADEGNIQLILYRVKRRNRARDQGGDNESFKAYQASLQRYLSERDVLLYDESIDGDVTLDYYSSDDHLAGDRMKDYTRLFWGKVEPLVRAGKDRERNQ